MSIQRPEWFIDLQIFKSTYVIIAKNPHLPISDSNQIGWDLCCSVEWNHCLPNSRWTVRCKQFPKIFPNLQLECHNSNKTILCFFHSLRNNSWISSKKYSRPLMLEVQWALVSLDLAANLRYFTWGTFTRMFWFFVFAFFAQLKY